MTRTHPSTPTRRRARAGSSQWRAPAVVFAFGAVVLALATFQTSAGAAIVPTVPLGTASADAVLAATTVTNTGGSVLDGSLALWPGTSVTGFPPGLVSPPGTTDVTDAVAQQAQSDLTTAYVDASTRSTDGLTPADLADQHLAPGVYAGPAHGALGLTGPLVLDGGGDPTAVFVIQTDSSLTTASSSTVSLVGGALECNVFWQVGSSATLGSSSVFVGTILAQTSVTVGHGATVHGRALARTGAVTLDENAFTRPACTPDATTTTSTAPSSTLPGTTLPATTVPDTTLPTTTVPDTTLPTTTVPDVTQPATTVPVVTLPATTVPVVTLPGTTLPATTVPDTTQPPPTLPATTLPTVTVPGTSTTTSPPVVGGPTTTTTPGGVTVPGPGATTTTTRPGTTSTATTAPATTAPGTTAPGLTTDRTSTGRTTTDRTTTALARTGADIGLPLILAWGLLLTGMLALCWSRRRQAA